MAAGVERGMNVGLGGGVVYVPSGGLNLARHACIAHGSKPWARGYFCLDGFDALRRYEQVQPENELSTPPHLPSPPLAMFSAQPLTG